MGITAAIRVATWLRQLFCEIDLDEFVAEPTIIYGDNIQANRLCKEHSLRLEISTYINLTTSTAKQLRWA